MQISKISNLISIFYPPPPLAFLFTISQHEILYAVKFKFRLRNVWDTTSQNIKKRTCKINKLLSASSFFIHYDYIVHAYARIEDSNTI